MANNPKINHNKIKEDILDGKEVCYTDYGRIEADVNRGESPYVSENSGTIPLQGRPNQNNQSSTKMGEGKFGVDGSTRRDADSGLSDRQELDGQLNGRHILEDKDKTNFSLKEKAYTKSSVSNAIDNAVDNMYVESGDVKVSESIKDEAAKMPLKGIKIAQHFIKSRLYYCLTQT